ncbi:MAG: oligosaccharide flippase family protein, partial [Candidatus Krumholzibacteriia bacterium]
SAYVDGLQRMNVTNLVYTLNAIIGGTAVSIAAILGHGLPWLAALQTAVGAGTLVILILYAVRETRRRHGSVPLRLDLRQMRQSLRYGVAVLGSSVAHLSNLHFEKLLLGRYAGVEMASLWEIGLRSALALRMLPSLLLSAIVPVVSHLSATSRVPEVRRVYRRAMRYTSALSLPLAAFAVIYMPSLLEMWIGDSCSPQMIWTARLLTLAHLGNVLLAVPLTLARGLGLVQFEARTAAAHVLLQVVLGCALVPLFGLRGAQASASITLLGIAGFGVVWMHRRMRLLEEPAGAFLGRHLTAPLVAAGFAVVASLALRTVFAMQRTGAPDTLASLFVAGLVFGVCYLAGFGAISGLDAEERALLTRPFRGW